MADGASVWWDAGTAPLEEIVAAYEAIPPRTDVIARVPDRCVSILDVGCANGSTGAVLKNDRPDRHVTGIEIFEPAAALARERLDEVVVADVQSLDSDAFPPARFDCILFADVLEHLPNPGHVLITSRRWLTADGVCIASLPNVAHYSVLRALLRRRWDYTSEGILDASHLRFFARANVESLVRDAGYDVERIDGNAQAMLGRRTRPVYRLARLVRRSWTEHFDTGYIVVARPRAAGDAAAA